MRRDPSLRGLSSDHHQALVLARRVRAGVDALMGSKGASEAQPPHPQIKILADMLSEAFKLELEPHFIIEEQLLLPALLELGELQLTARVAAEHAQLRSLAQAPLPSASGLYQFAELLSAHVRFEERELFPACERLLTEEQLGRVACARPHPALER